MPQKSPIDQIIKPVSKFIHLEYTSGLALFVSVILAIAWVNSPFKDAYDSIWAIDFAIGFDRHMLVHNLHDWINDGLMAIFFFVIGLELKREFIAGELSTIKKAALPMVAALGGMLVPAFIYFLINRGTGSIQGWGIPMATDIAFALALLSMAGKHIPSSVKVFLSALAVADDLGAVLVIAFFYSSHLDVFPLLIGGGFLLLLALGNASGIRNITFYLLIGFGVWVCFLLSGIHATIAGVLVAFTIPARTKINENSYAECLRKLSYDFEREIPANSTLTTPRQHETIERIKRLSMEAETPLQKVEYSLHPWVAFLIMPVFALANSGIIIGRDFLSSLINPISLGIVGGLLIGKFVGVLLSTWLMVKTGLSELPNRARWKHIIGVAMLAGVGFTMSLFISSLAFNNQEMVEHAKYGILLASIVAGTVGSLYLRKMSKNAQPA